MNTTRYLWLTEAFMLIITLAVSCAITVDKDLIDVYRGHYIGTVMPTPQRVRYGERWLPLWSMKVNRAFACILIERYPSHLERLAASEISAQVGYLARGKVDGELQFSLPILNDVQKANSYRVVICIGVAGRGRVLREVLSMVRMDAPKNLNPEGYAIRIIRFKGREFVLCIGADHRGAYYATQSLLQLMTVHNNEVVLREVEITDYPDYAIRAHQYDGSFPDERRARYTLHWMSKFKLNQLGFGQAYDRPMEWRTLSDKHARYTRYLCERARALGTVRVCFYPHPHRSKPKFNIRISNPKDIKALVDLCAFALNCGAGGIMLRSDDIHPLSEEDAERFGDKATAHAFLIKELRKQLKAHYPNFIFMFCPPYYQGYWLERPVGRAYLERLGKLIPKDVIVIWTGPVTRSLEIKEDDLERYATVIGRVPMLWDNTVYAHRNRYGYDPRHPHYLFDTFATKYPSTFPERTLGITYNWNISNPIALVGGINTADYLWNPDAYDPQRSLRDALAIVAGSNCVDDLLAFREAYYEIFDAVTANRIVENTSKLMAAERTLTQVYQRLSAKCDNREFVSALEGRLRYAQKLLTPVKTSLELIHHAHKSQLVDLNFKHGDWRRSSEGKWSCSVLNNAVEFSFPSRTRSFAGAYAQLSRHITVPKSPTGKYYLAFGVTDNYRNAGTPPRAWPGYMFKQVLVNGEVVWEDDVEGDEPIEQRVLQIIEVTDALKDEREAVIAFRAMDKRGVSNMSVRIQFSAPLITAGPFELLYRTVEIPGAPVLNVRKEISVLLRIRPTAIGRRQGLYIKMPPIQYFGYLHERGTVTLGIFINGKEYRVNSKTQLQAGRTYHIAFTYDGRRMRIFVNGRLEGERRITGAIDDGHGNLFIGSYRNMAQPFEGEIEELKLFARCLSSNEIQTDATAQFALEVKAQSLPMGLIGWWRPAREKLIARDYSGNANDGSIYWRWGIQ